MSPEQGQGLGQGVRRWWYARHGSRRGGPLCPWAALMWLEHPDPLCVNHRIEFMRFYPTEVDANRALDRLQAQGKRKVYSTLWWKTAPAQEGTHE